MMGDFIAAFGFALLMWWLSTGFILFLNHLHPSTYRRSLTAVTLLAIAALFGIHAGSAETTKLAALLAFAQALVVWAWLEMSYFMGLVTGPRKAPCPTGVRGWTRFKLALQTSLYHELAVIACGVVILVITWDAVNQIAAGTFLTLWLMRWSAKLNLFLGVPNVNTDWFPKPLRFLCSYMPVKPMNLLFPFTVTAATIVTAWLFILAAAAPEGFVRTAYALVGSLLALAVLEHWFLVLPLRDSLLWNWALRLAGREVPTSKPGNAAAQTGADRSDRAPSQAFVAAGNPKRANDQPLRQPDISAARIAP